jgi:hypothetical protein
LAATWSRIFPIPDASLVNTEATEELKDADADISSDQSGIAGVDGVDQSGNVEDDDQSGRLVESDQSGRENPDQPGNEPIGFIGNAPMVVSPVTQLIRQWLIKALHPDIRALTRARGRRWHAP